jgi:hypothetical protein
MAFDRSVEMGIGYRKMEDVSICIYAGKRENRYIISIVAWHRCVRNNYIHISMLKNTLPRQIDAFGHLLELCVGNSDYVISLW